MTLSVMYRWTIGWMHSDDGWDSESSARENAVLYAKKYNLDMTRIEIIKTTIERL